MYFLRRCFSMMSNYEIKGFARRQLKGNWGAIILALIISGLILIALTTCLSAVVLIALISPAYAFSILQGSSAQFLYPLSGMIAAGLLFLLVYVTAGFGLGLNRMFLSAARGHRVYATQIFAGFRDTEHLRHYFGAMLILWLIELILSIPDLYTGIRFTVTSPDYKATSFITSIVSMILALFIALTLPSSADHRDFSGFKAFRTSLYLMRNRKLRFFSLILGFFGWMLLVIVTAGIAGFYVFPYMQMSKTIFYLSAYSEEYPVADAVEGDYREVTEPSDSAKNQPSLDASGKQSYSQTKRSSEDTEEHAERSFDEARREYVDHVTDGTTEQREGEASSEKASDASARKASENPEHDSSDSAASDPQKSEAMDEAKVDGRKYASEEDAFQAYERWKREHHITIESQQKNLTESGSSIPAMDHKDTEETDDTNNKTEE